MSLRHLVCALLLLASIPWMLPSQTCSGHDVLYAPEVPQPGCACNGCGLNSFGANPWDPCGRPSRYYRSQLAGRLWFHTDMLVWGTKGVDLPALVSSSPSGTAIGVAGTLGDPSTTILFGDRGIHDDMRLGARIGGGFWLDLEHTAGLEFGYFGIDGENLGYAAGGNGDILARPFFNVNTGLQDARLIAHATTNIAGLDVTRNGTIAAGTNMEFLGGHVGARYLVQCSPCARLEFMGGYRALFLDDRVSFIETINTTTVNVGVDTVVETGSLSESIHASSEFHGLEVGMRASRWWNQLSVELLGKLAIGGSRNRITASGQQSTTSVTTPDGGTAGAPVTSSLSSGLLVQDSNSGRIADTDFGVVGELGLNANYWIHQNTTVGIGYSLILWNDVVRTADNFGLSIDPTQALSIPASTLNDETFWAQGLNVNVRYLF